MKSRQFLRRLIKPLLFAVAGSVAGYLYYWKVGCADGTCAVTSNPLAATFYGALIGYLLSVVFSPARKNKPGDSRS